MQPETETPSAVIIPFPKRGRGTPARVQTASIDPAKPGAPQPHVFVRPLPAASSPISGRTSPFASRAPSVPLARQTVADQAADLQARAGTSRAGAAPLSGVMAELDHALTQQGAAVARWRRAINDLRVAMDGLEGSLKQYRDSLAPKTNNGAAG